MRFVIILIFIIMGQNFVMAESSDPDQFIIVGVSGFGTRRPENAWQPSAVHEKLPRHSLIQSSHRLVHYASDEEIAEVIDEFSCRNGRQREKQLGLIVMANSWGSGKAIDLARSYKEKCGREVDLFFVIDGVRKPIFANGTKPPADKCYSYYQRKGLVRGKAIRGCSNKNYTKQCEAYGYGAVQCHIFVEWEGTDLASKVIRKFLNNIY